MRMELQYHSMCVCLYVCMAICHSNFSIVKNICLAFLLHLWHRFVDSCKYSFCECKEKKKKQNKQNTKSCTGEWLNKTYQKKKGKNWTKTKKNVNKTKNQTSKQENLLFAAITSQSKSPIKPTRSFDTSYTHTHTPAQPEHTLKKKPTQI